MGEKISKIYYLVNARMPTERAYGLQIAKTCEAFVQNGGEVRLIIPRQKKDEEDLFAYYRLRKIFEIKKILIPNLLFCKKIGFVVQSFIFSIVAAASFDLKEAAAIYSRDIFVLFGLILFCHKNIYFEAHAGECGFAARFVLKRAKGIICITEGLKNCYIDLGINGSKIFVAPDAVDLKLFKNLPDRKNCRSKLKLPFDKTIIMYVGSFALYEWKGLDIFFEAARRFADEYVFCAVGGSKLEIECLSRRHFLNNILLIERKRNDVIPLFLRAADILILPNKRGDIVSEKYTSPMKLFEYMASGTPIVASDLSSIREILNKENALLFEADNSLDLAEKINLLINNFDLGCRLAGKSFQTVSNYTWDKRAQNIINFISDSDKINV